MCTTMHDYKRMLVYMCTLHKPERARTQTHIISTTGRIRSCSTGPRRRLLVRMCSSIIEVAACDFEVGAPVWNLAIVLCANIFVVLFVDKCVEYEKCHVLSQILEGLVRL
jgi:hypothetical protein